jgi:selT/selW/selH-like putative selenoprotein
LNEQTEHEATAEEGNKGQFDVLADGEVVFSKEESGRFPEHAEIRELLG